MQIIILLFIGLTLSAKTLFIIDTTDILGKCTISKGDTMIIHPTLDIHIPRGIEVIECRTRDCVTYETERLQNLYRTNGISVIIIK
jgi:hypothetical protein